MKYIILLGDGMADYPIPSLGGKTPLEFAHTPNMDRIASEGTLGLVDTIPQGLPPGSDVANLSILGYDPTDCYSGRGPLEAASMGIQLSVTDVAFRCNLITLGNGNNPSMLDFTAGHINSTVANELIFELQNELGSDTFTFHPGVSYRHLMVWKNGKYNMQTTPPHDIIGRAVNEYLPQGDGADTLHDIMKKAEVFLCEHRINKKRLLQDNKPANAIWLWGQGRAPQIVPITTRHNLRGGMISAVDLLNGIGIYAGLEVIHVDGATGYIDTNYQGKAEKALEALQYLDFIFLHVEAPDEMGHEGNIKGKIKSIEDFDEKVVGTILSRINEFDSFKVMILSDHPTPAILMNHSADPSPFAVLSSQADENLQHNVLFSEAAAKQENIIISPGYRLMDYFIRDWRKVVPKEHH